MRSVHPNPRNKLTRQQSSSVASPPSPSTNRSPSANAQARKSPPRLRYTGGSSYSTGDRVPTVWCLKGRAHCATPPNQKRPRKSNPSETTPPLQPPCGSTRKKKKISRQLRQLEEPGRSRMTNQNCRCRFKLANKKAKRRGPGVCCWVEKLKDSEKRARGSLYIPWFGEALCLLKRKTIASRLSSCNGFPPGFFFFLSRSCGTYR